MYRVRALIATVLAAFVAAAPAYGHADPTIHYLETQNLLASVGLPATQDLELQLLGIVQAIERRGYPIKVSVIANETDTGGESAALEDPQAYAELVVRELELFFPVEAPVIIVTPNGFGVSGTRSIGGRLQRFPSGTDGRFCVGSRCRRWRPTRLRGPRCSRSGRPLPTRASRCRNTCRLRRRWRLPRALRSGAGGKGVPTWVWSLILGSVPLLAWGLYSLWMGGKRR